MFADAHSFDALTLIFPAPVGFDTVNVLVAPTLTSPLVSDKVNVGVAFPIVHVSLFSVVVPLPLSIVVFHLDALKCSTLPCLYIPSYQWYACGGI